MQHMVRRIKEVGGSGQPHTPMRQRGRFDWPTADVPSYYTRARKDALTGDKIEDMSLPAKMHRMCKSGRRQSSKSSAGQSKHVSDQARAGRGGY